jgi:hypothetical protein
MAHKQEEHESKPMYKSKDGFETVPLLRGFDIIKPLWRILEEIKQKVGKDCFICGGYARYCASPQITPVTANDVDVYCETEEVFNALKERIEKEGLEIRYENGVSLTYKIKDDDKNNILAYVPTIQLIKPIQEARIVAFGDKKTIIENFDFSVIRAAILSDTEVMVDADFIHDEEHKLLRLKNIHCPISSTLRCMKYSRKGYFLRPFECLKLFIDWSDRPDEYRIKLIDFLDKASQEEGLSKEEVEELEEMMRID